MSRVAAIPAYILLLLVAALALSASDEAASLASVPDLQVIYTDTLVANLKPCNCGGVTTGGIAKLSTTIKELREGFVGPTVVVDLGNYNSKYDRFTAISALAICQYFRGASYAVVGIAENELLLEPDILLGQLRSLDGIAVVSNCDLRPPLCDYVSKHATTSADGITIAFLAFVAPDTTSPSIVSISSPEAALRSLSPEIGHADLTVVLCLSPTLSPDELHLEGVDVVLGMEKKKDVDVTELGASIPICGTPRNLAGGRTLHSVLVHDLDAPQVLVQEHSMFPEIEDDPEISELVQSAELAKVDLLRARIADADPAKCLEYAGPKACQECHVAQYLQWRKTRHSKSFRTLQGIVITGTTTPQSMNPECLQCHTTAFSEFEGTKREFNVLGVSCEQCHGPGQNHVDFYLMSKIARSLGSATSPAPPDKYIDLAPQEGVCLVCHNQHKSPDFNHEAYMVSITHQTPEE